MSGFDMAIRAGEGLRDVATTLAEDNARLRADNERLRALVKDAEWNCGEYTPHCVYCESDGPLHAADCEAFTPDGVVR